MNFTIASLAITAGLLPTAASAQPAGLQPTTVTAQCTTDATGWDGRRKSCDSEWQSFTAPAGYVLAEKTLKGGVISGNGSATDCHVVFRDNIDVIPGVPQPRTIALRGHARSPKGHSSGRGWVVCRYTIDMVPLR